VKGALAGLLKNPRIWRGRETQSYDQDHGQGSGQSRKRSIATGFTDLDRQLAGGGWPRAALTEVISEHHGVGELRLLMPALVRLSQTQANQEAGGWVAWIAPPYLPYAPALVARGLNLSRVLMVHTREPNDVLWATEQALRSGTCTAVLSWIAQADDRRLRRLQLAAEAGDALGFVFRSPAVLAQTSPAALRIELKPQADQLTIRLHKQRGGSPLTLTLPNLE
jgi:cell division inhibitor SulA/protein ImuA